MDLHRIEGATEVRYEIEAVAVDAPGRRLLVRWGLKDGGFVMAGGALG